MTAPCAIAYNGGLYAAAYIDRPLPAGERSVDRSAKAVSSSRINSQIDLRVPKPKCQSGLAADCQTETAKPKLPNRFCHIDIATGGR